MLLLEERILTAHKIWIKAWSERLGYCNDCGEEYKASEQLEIEGETCCPKCESNQGMTFYYCEDHGSPDCNWCE
jgi:hypothetical protein